jgi:hypothetical protein
VELRGFGRPVRLARLLRSPLAWARGGIAAWTSSSRWKTVSFSVPVLAEQLTAVAMIELPDQG